MHESRGVRYDFLDTRGRADQPGDPAAGAREPRIEAHELVWRPLGK
jgi:hypothetical protein